MNTWAPGIAFPSGPNVPPNDENAYNNDFFYETDRNRLWRHDGDGSSGSWIDLGEAAHAIQNCGTSLPPSGSEGVLFNKYNTGEIYQWIGNDPGSWRNIGSNKYGLPLGVDALTFTDITDPERLSAKLGLVLVDGNSPILATDQGFVVKKDLSAGGFIATNQGEVWIGHGREDPTDVPKIILDHAGIGYPTLYLRQRLWDGQIGDWTVTTPAHLDLGNLTAHGNILIEKDTPQIRLNSISATNDPSIIFYDNSVIKISQGYDVENDLLYIYDHLNSRTAMSLTHNSDLGVFRNITAGGRLVSNVATGTSPIQVTSQTTCTNLSADMLDGQHGSFYQNASNLNAGTVPTARLGTGTASSSTYLRGDSTWTTLPTQQWTAGTVSSVSTPLTISSNVLSLPQANGSTNGYLSAFDWNTFNNKYGQGSTPTFGDITISKSSPTLYLTCTAATNYHITSATDNNLYFSNASANLAYLNANTLWLSNNLYVTGGATVQTNLGVNNTITTNGLNLNNFTVNNVTASRSIDVSYVNNTGRTQLIVITVVITGSGQSGYDTATLWIGNGTNSWNIATANNNYCTAATPFTFMLPAGWSCQMHNATGHPGRVNIQTWYEFTL